VGYIRPVPESSASGPVHNPVLRALYVVAGLILAVLGIAGFFLPGLPGTPLLLAAAWLFSKSNERLYRWTMTNRWFGETVSIYRAGLGIPQRIKVTAITTVVIVISTSVLFFLDRTWLRIAVVGLGAYGVFFILTRPTYRGK
jgi:uncharacterized membrane protein YbaN (DUF454 family)